jgi:hypothetical protein
MATIDNGPPPRSGPRRGLLAPVIHLDAPPGIERTPDPPAIDLDLREGHPPATAARHPGPRVVTDPTPTSMPSFSRTAPAGSRPILRSRVPGHEAHRPPPPITDQSGRCGQVMQPAGPSRRGHLAPTDPSVGRSAGARAGRVGRGRSGCPRDPFRRVSGWTDGPAEAGTGGADGRRTDGPNRESRGGDSNRFQTL